MAIKKILPFLMMAFIASCTNDDFFPDQTSDSVGVTQIRPKIKVTTNVPIDNSFSDTRASLEDYDDGGTVSVIFDDSNETPFGICSLDGKLNVPVDFYYDEETKEYELLYDSLLLNVGQKYIMYYPYNYTFAHITPCHFFEYDSQEQTKKDCNGIVDTHYYMYSDPVELTEDGIMNFELHPVGSVLKLNFLELKKGKYSRVVLRNIDGLKTFCHSSIYFFTGNGVEIPTCPEGCKSDSVEIKLNSFSANGKKRSTMPVQMALYPLYTGNFVVEIYSQDGTVYSSTPFEPIDLKAGYGYVKDKIKVTKGKYTVSDNANRRDGIKYVDLGTNVYWATVNVGASRPQDEGNTYAFGDDVTYMETYGFSSYSDNANPIYKNTNREYIRKTLFCWDEYKWNKQGTLCKYIVNNPAYLPVIQSDDDVATKFWSENWRTPTTDEMKQLINMCYWKYTANYRGTGKAGYIVFKAKDVNDRGIEENDAHHPQLRGTYTLDDAHIFLPYTTIHGNNGIESKGVMGRYMTSQMYYNLVYKNGKWIVTNNEYNCLELRRSNEYGSPKLLTHYPIYQGSVVRPVCAK